MVWCSLGNLQECSQCALVMAKSQHISAHTTRFPCLLHGKATNKRKYISNGFVAYVKQWTMHRTIWTCILYRKWISMNIVKKRAELLFPCKENLLKSCHTWWTFSWYGSIWTKSMVLKGLFIYFLELSSVTKVSKYPLVTGSERKKYADTYSKYLLKEFKC